MLLGSVFADFFSGETEGGKGDRRLQRFRDVSADFLSHLECTRLRFGRYK